MNNYEQQAADFLAATNTTLTAKFERYGKHFDDDKESRDIFTVTIKNAAHRFRLKFGQSLNNSTGNGGNLPTAYDVLACVQKYPVYSFEDFCGDYGYDTDSRKAYKTYKAVLREWSNVAKLFTREQIEQLQEIN